MTDRPSITLPLCVLGAGIVHGLCIAALLPLLITVPAPRKSEGGHSVIDVELRPKAVTPKPDARVIEPSPELVTGSVAVAGALRARAIANMPREVLREAEPIPVTLALAEISPEANLMTAKADPMITGAIPAAVEEIEAEDPPAEPIKATDGETARSSSLARSEPAASPSNAVQRRVSAPAQKGQAIRLKPKAKASPRAVAPAAKRRAAVPARRSVSTTARRPAQARAQIATQPMGLGLFFRRPSPARQPAVRR